MTEPSAPDVEHDPHPYGGHTSLEARRIMGAQPDRPRAALPIRVVHKLLRELVAIFVRIMELGRRFGAYLLRTEYVVAGGCKQRGACCHHILLEWTPLLDRYPLLGRLVLWKLTRFYSLYDRGYTWEVEDGMMARVLGCHALLPDGRCGEYRTRPMFCRTYPELPLLGKPGVLKGCGYAFGRRDGRPDTIEAGRPVEQLVQLKRLGNRRLEP
ncbi:hypothetical protein L6R52_20455 [Myxococcota bacterium]|nr:hypothetical protein [Myxococcota bacterium]